MNDERKTKKQLIAELQEMRRGNDFQRQQIAAVGRVQMAAMSMRSSDDILKVVSTQYEVLKAIFPTLLVTTINYVDEERNIIDEFLGLRNPQVFGLSWSLPELVSASATVAVMRKGRSNFIERVGWQGDFLARWRSGEAWSFPFSDLTDHNLISVWGFSKELGFGPVEKIPALPENPIVTIVSFPKGYVSAITEEPIVDLASVIQQFTDALSLGYLRFLDYQQLEAELEKAHDLQMGLMPTESPQILGYDITGRCIPATHVGGDFFQYFQQDGKLSICMADVTGHAMAAAVPVMMFSGVLKSQMVLGEPTETLFGRLNRTMHGSFDSHTYVCFAMGELDVANSGFRLANSGCPYPFHYLASEGDVTELQGEDTYPLGVQPETAYTAIETRLETGDYVVFCSDGIIEAGNADEDIFGFEKTAEVIRAGCAEGLSAEGLIDRLVGAVQVFAGDTPQGDDMTCVVLRVEA